MMMRAIIVDVTDREWDKVDRFVTRVNDEETFAYRLSRTRILIVTEGELSKTRAEAMVMSTFDNETELMEIRR